MATGSHLRRTARRLWHGTPGRRFEEYHARAATQPQSLARRVAIIALAVVALVLGVVEVVLPGPAVLFFLIGGALLATQSRKVARALDWVERRARQGWRKGCSIWAKTPLAGRATFTGLIACAGLAAAFVMYRVASA